LLTISKLAREKLDEFSSSSDDGSLALKVAIVGRGKKGFEYDLQLVPASEQEEGDAVFESEGLTVIISAKSAPYMDGSSLDFQETLMGGGFHFENPNPIWLDDVALRVQDVIDTEVTPAVASHGGTVSLLDVKDGEAIIAFGGGCQGCSAVDVTLKHGVETMIKEKVPEITEITDATDHAAGANPFY
jgi:Fe/S biogenesis protein NfuA